MIVRDPVSGFFQGPGQRIDGADAEASAGQKDGPEVLDFRRPSERADVNGDLVAGLEQRQLVRRRPDEEEDRGHGSFLGVPVGDGQGDALAALVGHEDDELAGPAFFRHFGRVDLDQVEVGHEAPAVQDLGHYFPPRMICKLLISRLIARLL